MGFNLYEGKSFSLYFYYKVELLIYPLKTKIINRGKEFFGFLNFFWTIKLRNYLCKFIFLELRSKGVLWFYFRFFVIID